MNKEIAKWLTRRAEAQLDTKLIKEIKDQIKNATKLRAYSISMQVNEWVMKEERYKRVFAYYENRGFKIYLEDKRIVVDWSD